MLKWCALIDMLGRSKNERNFTLLVQVMNELPVIEPDMLGIREYYSFYHSGILFLAESEQIEQISFYIEPKDGFFQYEGELPIDNPSCRSESDIVNLLGEPAFSGGGKHDLLLGYMNRWVKYEKNGYNLHVEFNENDLLSKISVMK